MKRSTPSQIDGPLRPKWSWGCISYWPCVYIIHRIGFLLITLYIFDVSVYRTVSGDLLSSFIISLMSMPVCASACTIMRKCKHCLWVKLSIMMLPWQPLREKTVYPLLLLSPLNKEKDRLWRWEPENISDHYRFLHVRDKEELVMLMFVYTVGNNKTCAFLIVILLSSATPLT